MHNIDEKTVIKIVTVAYGDGNIFDKLKIYYKLIFNNQIRKTFFEYRNTKRLVHKNGSFKLSNSIVEKVNYNLNLDKKNDKSFLSEIYLLFITKPLVPAAAIFIVISAVVWSLFFRTPVHHNINKQIYTKQELAIAEKKAQYALAIVSNVLAETNNTVTKDILINEVAKPINEGMTIINNLIN